VSANPEAVMFTAARGRPAADEVLLIRQHGQSDEPPSDTWEFPRVGEFDYPAALEPWTDGVLLARVDGPFDPPGLPAEDFQWVSADFARTCAPTAFHPDVPPALRRFDGPILDQILAHIEARADSNSQGDFSMGTETRADFTRHRSKPTASQTPMVIPLRRRWPASVCSITALASRACIRNTAARSKIPTFTRSAMRPR
jgi:hypothetical protein